MPIDLPTSRVRAPFEFGHRDGVGDEVRRQHPLGVPAGTGLGHVHTLAGPERPDLLLEPSGLSVGRGRLWVTDANHHTVQVVDLTTGAARVPPLRLL